MPFITMNFFSKELGMNQTVHVYLPEKRLEEGKHYPVVYLLHDAGESHQAWIRESAVLRIAEREGVALVLPAAMQGYYTDMKLGYRFFQYLSEELPCVIKENFPVVSQKREETFVAGVGIGGYGAVKLGLRKPERILAAASVSGQIDIVSYVKEVLEKKGRESDRLHHVFGEADEILYTQNDLYYMAAQGKNREVKPEFLLVYGNKDKTKSYNQSFYQANEQSYTIECLEYVGKADWTGWSAQVEAVLTWFSSKGKGV